VLPVHGLTVAYFVDVEKQIDNFLLLFVTFIFDAACSTCVGHLSPPLFKEVNIGLALKNTNRDPSLYRFLTYPYRFLHIIANRLQIGSK
jgi:hypothetical protein